MQKEKPKTSNELRVRTILTILIVICAVRQFINDDYQNVFICFLSLFLLGLPRFIEKKLDLDLPPFLEVIIMLFIFSAEIMGEINAYYEKIPMWDTMLHTINGFLMAAIGFSLVDIFNRSERFLVKLSPVFVAIVAFCFSMTIGVLWEFFEFFMDRTFAMDMQKDFFVTSINSVALNPTGANVPIHLQVDSLLVNGEDWIAKYGGYLDIGLIDTMKDLFVNFIGAVVFSVIGYFYVKHRGRGRFAPKFIPIINHGDGYGVDNFGNPIPEKPQKKDQKSGSEKRRE
ncbi:hypothetical protein [Butyricicoccus porcorum]|uniref:hypothetical protein n=1 Tax=Butyricicoccus porcorum TaxID=1945634 RepID=UPI001FA931A6|nr:hypothetical protein [Butyricicoccus porcorum]MCI6925594.1 hypothetical protein [Butyricicoccus porcorum]MDD6985881.1 hypothetical protein [Butyricicoccus porcorum]MDY4482433.1 hypothetical protein [Butyricicoccus porcorum]